NQLLATGGLLFFLQSFVTFLWTTDHRTVRLVLPVLEVGGMFLSFARLIAFAISLVAMLGLWVFLRRTYIGTAIRAVSQDREAMALMGADPQRVYFVTSAVGGAMAGLAGALLIIQYSVHPFFGAAFGPFLPMGGMRQYILHVLIQILIWSFIGGAWSVMGRFGLVSLGHGAFLGLGAYTVTLLWNFYSLTPWIGGVAAAALTVVVALVVAYPCSRFQVVGHYFALVTLAVSEVVRLLIIAERNWTGGSLGLSLKPATGDSLLAMQFADKRVFYYASLVLWLAGLWIWYRVDRSMARAAMEAIGEDETAAASVGIHVT